MDEVEGESLLHPPTHTSLMNKSPREIIWKMDNIIFILRLHVFVIHRRAGRENFCRLFFLWILSFHLFAFAHSMPVASTFPVIMKLLKGREACGTRTTFTLRNMMSSLAFCCLSSFNWNPLPLSFLLPLRLHPSEMNV
jgi:hypothetical protein